MTVKAVLNEKGGSVFSMSPDATLADVVRELAARKVGAVLITEGDHLAGILSERDVVRVLAKAGADALKTSASSVMTAKVETCGLDDMIDDVMERMTSSRFRHMPVVDGGSLVGVVSIGDVVKRRIEEAVRERDQMREYIHSI
ncbi:CBS domain-containing protein [Acuticoccus sp. MNP-M23]|uniref:CBS domain-containing protein n=1 Tax=Acuticoccus sp. MNP-M23 TaxID=3072793 RepID=UPI0028163F30|nr:CBS domain-containing protein [Acuticoccus sp. MNP-M23]WMS42505.1 CBS domain-containing protein [Acuticoccus sp. MNP-M23]